jgi:plasmid stabilization system protein ParE
MRIEYHPALESELREIIDYYEERSLGLGVAFLEEFERQVIAIAAMPERWMVVVHDIQRSLMKRFPYVIYFRVVAGSTIRITVVKHEKHHPRCGLSRR